MRILVFNPEKKMDQNPSHQYTFYEVLQVLYHFFDQEYNQCSGGDVELRKRFREVKERIQKLAIDLGNSAYLDNWYKISSIKNQLKEIVDYDEVSGYSSKKDI